MSVAVEWECWQKKRISEAWGSRTCANPSGTWSGSTESFSAPLNTAAATGTAASGIFLHNDVLVRKHSSKYRMNFFFIFFWQRWLKHQGT